MSLEFSKQEYWSGFPFPSLEDLPNPGIEPRSPALRCTAEPPGKSFVYMLISGKYMRFEDSDFF